MKNQPIHKSKNLKVVVVAGAVLLGALAVVLSTTRTRADNREYSTVVHPDAVVYGRTFGEWSAAWWQWAFSIPVASHPLFDNTDDCSVGQSGPVWFLGGKFCQAGPNAPPCTPGVATRSCTLPRGKALFFPITNIEDSAPEEPNYGCGTTGPLLVGTIAEMRKCVETYFNGAGLSAEIDGRTIPNLLENFHEASVVFGITLPEDNVLKAIGEDIAAGTYYPAVDEGVYLMLAPLPPGHHYLHLGGPSQNITYHLVVMR